MFDREMLTCQAGLASNVFSLLSRELIVNIVKKITSSSRTWAFRGGNGTALCSRHRHAVLMPPKHKNPRLVTGFPCDKEWPGRLHGRAGFKLGSGGGDVV